jgi:hypothetical protein
MDADGWTTRNEIDFATSAGPPGVQRAFDAAGLTAGLPIADGT